MIDLYTKFKNWDLVVNPSRTFQYEKAFKKFYEKRQPTVKNLVKASKGMELVRMRESYLSKISRKVNL